MDRRTSLQWMLAASAAWPWLTARAAGGSQAAAAPNGEGYGTDPNLVAMHHAGEFWPLTFTPAQRRLAQVLSDLIIPADAHSPAASAVGVVDFIDEWVSAPYPTQQRDRSMLLEGFRCLDAQAKQRFGKSFVEARASDRTSLCDEICDATRAAPELRGAASGFALHRDLTAGAFYSTPVGRKDLGYLGNVPRTHFDPPPPKLLRKLKLQTVELSSGGP